MKLLLKYAAIMACALLFGLSSVSCSDDKENDEPSAVVGTVTITNKSTYTIDSFMVYFTNDKISDNGEIITREDKGTLKPSASVSVEIPIGATYYHMSTYMDGRRYFSADYAVSVKKQILTNQIIGEWKAYSN